MVRFLIAVLAILLISMTAMADIKITMKTTVAGHSSQNTTYIKGARQRMDQGMGILMIYQCDKKQIIQINDTTKRYIITPLDVDNVDNVDSKSETTQRPHDQTRELKGGIVTFTINSIDTGERKQSYGYTARHIKTIMEKKATPDACDPEEMHMEMDGWYIDLEYGIYCGSDRPVMPAKSERTGCRDEIHYKHTGNAKPGFPIELTTQINSNGRIFSTFMEVMELSQTALDEALFEVPTGYTPVKSMQELFGVPSISSIMSPTADKPTPRGESNIKTPGMVRIGVVAFNNKTGQSLALEKFSQEIISDLSSANIEAIALGTTSSPQIETEAAQKECDYILYTDIAELKKPSAASKLGKLLDRSSDVIKERYEVKLDYRLFIVGNASPLLKSSAGAKEEGMADVAISAALQREAVSLIKEISKKR